MFQKWVEILGTGDHVEPRIIYEKRRICSNHFSADNFSSGTKTLRSNALPNVRPAISIQSTNKYFQ